MNIIQPHVDLPFSSSGSEYRKKRVAAYARVSTDSDEQLSSYEAQVDFYTRHISSHLEWEFVDVYTDEGISGTNTKKRDGFNRMITDALDGKIDLILTKSISRFARNTVDTLTTVRRLKEKDVEVHFEKENIYTLDTKGEVLITIMSSLAQEESRSISENVTWGKKKSMADGKIALPYKNFLGYKKGQDGLPQIVEAEADIVWQIYRLYLDGNTIRNIVRYLTAQGIPTPGGKKQWSVSTVTSILTNEKYKGDARLQKTYTADFLSKRIEQNKGEIQQYYIENSHPAIIDQETFDLVQSEIQKRRPNRRQLNNNSPFAAKLICGECGGCYGSKVWHSNSKYRNRIWRCNRKYANSQVCLTPNLREDEIKPAFVQAINQILGDKEQYITRVEQQLLLDDTAELEKVLEKLQAEHDTLISQIQHYIGANKREIRDQQKHIDHYRAMDEELKKLEPQVNQLKDKILEKIAQKEKTRRFLDELRQMDDLVIEFDENLWYATIELVTVHSDKTLGFRFKDETRITKAIKN
ncbi:MAG: recombinase family protein [Candidatus Saccharibacteria bacterium]